MTVYTELLRSRLERHPDLDRPVADLVINLLLLRARVEWAKTRGVADPPGRLLALLAYDEALVRLCERVGVPQSLLEPFPPSEAREEAEAALWRRLPLLTILEHAVPSEASR